MIGPSPARSARLRRRLAAVLTAAGLTGVAGPACALDLLQAYREALLNDSQIASARAQAAALQERTPQARAAMLPQVGVGATASRQYVDTDRSPSMQYNAQNYGLSLRMPLFRQQNLEALEQAKLQGLLGDAQLAQSVQDLIVRVAQAYFDTLAAQDNVATIEAQKRAIGEQLASAKRNFEVGTTTITDQQEAQARFDLATAQEIAARNELEVRRAALSQLIGRPVDALEILPRGAPLQRELPGAQDTWVERARADHFGVQQARIQGEIARREIARQRAARLPTLDVVGQIGHARSPTLQAVGVTIDSRSVGLELSVPLYTGGGISARVREAVNTHERALADLETTRRAAELGARQSYLGLNSGLSQVAALEAAERSSQLALDSNLLGYQVGVRINIDVLNAQQQLYTTRRDLARARYNVLVSNLQLEATAGTLDEEDVRRINALLVPAGTAPAAANDTPQQQRPANGNRVKAGATRATGSESTPVRRAP